jgi:LuxR family transcriptional regulator, maltose regulon positive regulatory protein
MNHGFDQPNPPFEMVRTKLLVPTPRARWVPRPQLVAALARGTEAKLTLLCAPTGWGKTSLIAEWATSCASADVAWLSLDPGDDEPLRFWRSVTAALSTAAPSLSGSAQRRLRSPVVSIWDEILPALVNDLAEVSRSLVLVLDDFHVISRQEIASQLAYVIERLPHNAHVVVATQTDPPLRLGRLRAVGDLTELRGEQLRFTDDEAARLLNRVHGLELGSEEVAAVQRRTEGWVAGLNLAALSLKRSSDRERVLDRLPAEERFLVDYLWDEVVLGQPRTVRHFLMRTAILERLTGSLCDAVAERHDSEEMLRELERANLFVVPLDPAHASYRYHNLFRELLRSQLERFAADLIPDLHRRASTWYAANNLMVDAIAHALAAGDVNYAADELEQHWLEFYSSGQATTILDWIDRLPAETIAGHPTLVLARGGIARAIGRLDEVEEWFARADALAADAPASGLASSIAGGAAINRAMYRLALGDVEGAIECSERALALEPVEGSTEHTTAGYFLGIVLFYESPDRAAPWLERYLATVPPGEHDVRRYFATALMAEVYALRGELQEAERLARESLETAHTQQLEEHPPTEQAHAALGAVLFARDEFDAAEEEFERAAALSRRGGDRMEHAHALVWLARARARQLDIGGARAALDGAHELVPGLGESCLKQLVGALQQELGARPAEQPVVRSSSPLTEAELRVLRLFPTDLTYREIAQHLYVSLNTLRTHARRVRRKLGVTTRVDAVARAREAGLL